MWQEFKSFAFKGSNQRSVLMRGLRDYGNEFEETVRNALQTTVDRLAQIIRRVQLADDNLERLRGSEGEAAKLYFSVFGHLVRSEEPDLQWHGRSRRPPLDP